MLDHEFKAGQRYGYGLIVLMLDVENFKAINDTHGHQQGDLVLAELGRIMKRTSRATDVWARYGGEEFVGLVTHGGLQGARILAEKIRGAIEEHVFPGMNRREGHRERRP